MQRIKTFSLLLLLTLFLSGCFSSTTVYEGISYPKTTASQFTFLEESVPADCNAFAHVMMTTKEKSTGKDIASAMHKEAESKGANLVLLGVARTLTDDAYEENQFDYYGPDYVYSFQKTWLGWKFGFDEWDKAATLCDIGCNSWGDGNTTFDNSLIIPAVFLRCGPQK